MVESTKLMLTRERNLREETRGMDYCSHLDRLAVSCANKVIFLKDMTSHSPFDSIESPHGYPTLACFNTDVCAPSHILVADNEGPIDVFDLQTKSIVRSYLEHGSRVTGLAWCDGQSYVSSSADGTVRFYKLTDHHSYCTINVLAGTCGAHISSFSPKLLAFGTTKGKYYIYDIRNTSIPYLEAKAHSKTVSNVAFVSDFELLTVGTDSTAKLWDLQKTICTMNYEGIVHHKCFIGIDSFEDFIAFGGEDGRIQVFNKHNSLCVASKSLCSSTSFVCGCALKSVNGLLQLIAVGNQGHLMFMKLD